MREDIEGYRNIWRCAPLTGIEKKWDAVKIPSLIYKYTSTQVHKYTNTQLCKYMIQQIRENM